MKTKGSPLADKHWVVRAGRGAVHASEFLEHGIVALGLAAEVGAAALAMDRERLLEATSARRPDWSPKRAAAQGNQLARFIHEMQVGDRVATYDGERRVFYVGTIEGPATFDEGRIAGQPFVRAVTWDGRVPRDSLSIEARNSLGAILSLFLVRDGVAHELQTKAVERDAPESTPAERPVAEDRDDRATLDDLRLEAREKAAQFIQDMIVALDWDDVQELVAGILRPTGWDWRSRESSWRSSIDRGSPSAPRRFDRSSVDVAPPTAACS